MPEPALASERASSQRRWTNIGNPWLSKRAAVTAPSWFPRFSQHTSNLPQKNTCASPPWAPRDSLCVGSSNILSAFAAPQTTRLLCSKEDGSTAEAGGDRSTWKPEKQEVMGGNVSNRPNFQLSQLLKEGVNCQDQVLINHKFGYEDSLLLIVNR